MRAVVIGFLLLLGMNISVAAHDSGVGTPEDARKMAEAAEAYFKKNGLDALIKGVKSKGELFRHRELYVFVTDFAGTSLAHAGNPKLAGRNYYNLKDISGEYLMRKMIGVAKEKKRGWVEYKWPKPGRVKFEKKRTYIITLNDKYWLGVGAYSMNTAQ